MSSEFIYTTLLEKCKQETKNLHYLKRYVNFIQSCITKNKNISPEIYTEKHHILPKAIFPEYIDITVNDWNSAILTARQHYICHWILAEALGGKMWLAFDMMTISSKSNTRKFKISAKIYEKIRIEKSIIISKQNKGRLAGDKNPMFGKTGELSPSFGLIRSDKTKLKMKLARKNTHKVVKCPHCGVNGESRVMQSWHFDNCGKTDRNSGAKNGRANKINIYNNENILIRECHGNFGEVCRELGIPGKPLCKSYKNNGAPIMTSNLSIRYAERNGLTEFIGWYAKYA